MDFPVFFRVERTDLALTLHHQLHGHRLHATCRQATGNLGPQQWRNHVAHYAIEKAIQEAFSKPGELDINRVNAQQARRFLDRVVGYMVSPLLCAVVITVLTGSALWENLVASFCIGTLVFLIVDGIRLSVWGEFERPHWSMVLLLVALAVPVAQVAGTALFGWLMIVGLTSLLLGITFIGQGHSWRDDQVLGLLVAAMSWYKLRDALW